ncbi:SHC-transforming protein 4 [Monodelphis domestica]|uniref:SHC adaptor protein 4 n=1 Tax=Monodelphis domestica TaxID=13616 RepID=F7GFD9_MONDO|nr:SHC-transforming protein 4 [Monodelphis domestica]
MLRRESERKKRERIRKVSFSELYGVLKHFISISFIYQTGKPIYATVSCFSPAKAMRGRSPENLSGHVLYVGLFGHPGMLHRAKYSRFRNEPITSLDEGSSAGSVNVKGVPPTSPSSPLPVHLPGEDVTLAAQDNPTPLCTLMPRMASLRLANPANLLGLKNFCLGTREVPKLKLLENRGAAPSSPTSPEGSLSQATSAASPQPDGEALESCILPTSEAPPSLGNQDGSSRQHLLGTGMNYCVRYIGCVEVLQSMRSLDFGMRTQVTREAISRLCEAVPGENGPIKRRKPPVKFLSSVLGRSNLQFSGINIKLTVSTCSLTLMNIDTQQIIANHHMQSISFASGGDPDTTDYVAYVAKDPVNQRACHILECPSGMAQDVINTIGQAFELRFKEYLKNPSSLNIPSEREEVNIDDITEEKEEHEYYNEIPGKQPPAGGVLDARMKVQTTEQRTYCPIQCEKLCCSPRNPKCSSVYENCLEPSKAIGSISERIVKTQRDPPLTKHRCRVDLFDDPCYINTQPFQTAICPGNQDPAQGLGSPLHGAKVPETVQPSATSRTAGLYALPQIKRQLRNEDCYHGKLSRKAAESLLIKDGDFLVRESATSPGQYVLSGLQGGQAKHLLLVDPEGKVRTKDHVFDNVGHLIRYHMENSLPIISSGSEVSLRQPVRKENQKGHLQPYK